MVGEQGAGRQDESPWMGVRPMEVRGRKSNERRSDGWKSVDGGPTNESPTDGSFVERTKVQRWQCCRLQRCNNDGNVVTCNVTTAMALQRATLLLLRHYGATVATARTRSDGAVAALVAALLLLLLELAAMALL
jgi:hypothetical protein